LKARTRDEYRSKRCLHINDSIGQQEIAAITPEMSTPRKREPIILSVSEVAKLADVIAPQRFKALILLSAWCGLRRVKPSS